MKRIALTLVLVALGTAAVAADPQQAHEALLAACPGLKTHAADVTIDAPRRQAAGATEHREKKWAEVYAITAKVADKPSARVLSELRAQGQRCEFGVEASKAKDVSVPKSACMALCLGREVASGWRGYITTSGERTLIK